MNEKLKSFIKIALFLGFGYLLYLILSPVFCFIGDIVCNVVYSFFPVGGGRSGCGC